MIAIRTCMLCMYVCVYVCMYVYVCMHVCMYVGICMYACMYARTYVSHAKHFQYKIGAAKVESNVEVNA